MFGTEYGRVTDSVLGECTEDHFMKTVYGRMTIYWFNASVARPADEFLADTEEGLVVHITRARACVCVCVRVCVC